MRYTLTERLIWSALSPVIHKWIKTQHPTWEAELILDGAKGHFKRLVKMADDIGSKKENPYRLYLDCCMTWLSFNRASNGEMTQEDFQEMVAQSLATPIIQMAMAQQAGMLFADESHTPRANLARTVNQTSDSPLNWHAEITETASVTDYTVKITSCGVCALAQQEGCSELARYMCRGEDVIAAMAGGKIRRLSYMASGQECCTLNVVKKG